jgi:entericidin A
MSPFSTRSILILVVAALTAFAIGGCNTAQGFGKDVEKVGDKIQDKAAR